MPKGTRAELLQRSQKAHEKLRPWREARKKALERSRREEIPKLYGNSEVEPDGGECSEVRCEVGHKRRS